LFYSSVPQSYFDIFSYNILFSPPSVPQSYFEDISWSILFFSLFSPLSVPQSYFEVLSYEILFSSLLIPLYSLIGIVCLLLSSSLFVLQEITSFCSLLFGFKRTQYITELGVDYNVCGGFTWWVSDCEELVGVTHRG